tara:strand:+ start:907 stop:1824 length:918 start_codon:yes stop_codon:yes gene_type:complete
MQNFITKTFQNFIRGKDIRKYKKSAFYYIFFRLVRKYLNSNIEVNIFNFKIWASNKKNKTSYSVLRKCDFTDKSELKLIEEISKKNKIFFIDCGSNFGFYSLYTASLSKENNIISLEASPTTYKDHKENIILNNFKNIELFNIAVSENDDQLLNLNESKNDWESSIFHSNFDKILKTSIKTITIDSLSKNRNFDNLEVIIKLDVEGYEMNSIEGAFDTIKNYSPLIIIEFSKFIQKNEKYNFDFLIKFLKKFDYLMYDHKFNQILMEDVLKRLDNLPKGHLTIGNNFLVKKSSKLEKFILNLHKE